MFRLTAGCFLALSSMIAVPAIGQSPDTTRPLTTAKDAELQLAHRPWSAPRMFDIAQMNPGPVATTITINDDPDNDMPREIAITPDGTTALVVGRDSDNVTYFDIATRTATRTVAIGDFATDIAINAAGTRAVITNLGDDTVTILNIAAGTTQTVPVTGSGPYSVTIVGNNAYVGVINDAITSAISVINIGTATETLSIATGGQGVLAQPFDFWSGVFLNNFTKFAVTSDGSMVIVPDFTNDAVNFYNAANGNLIQSVSVNDAPVAIDLTSDNATAVIDHEGTFVGVSVINVATQTVTNTYPIPGTALANQYIKISPDNQMAFGVVITSPTTADTYGIRLSDGNVVLLATGASLDVEFTSNGTFAICSGLDVDIVRVSTRAIVATVATPASGINAQTASSPNANLAIALSNRRQEDLHFFSTNGLNSAFIERVKSGEPQEGDTPRTLAASGSQTITANFSSRNAAIVSSSPGVGPQFAEIGDFPLGIAVSADGTTALVCNSQSNTVSVIDMATATTLVDVPVPGGPATVTINAAGTRAYVSTWAEATDEVVVINVNGASSSVIATINAGNCGGVVFTYAEFNQGALTPDGSRYLQCVAADGNLLIINTANNTVVNTVNVAPFPIGLAISPNGQFAYVGNAIDGLGGVGTTVKVVNISTGSVVATINNTIFPLDLAVKGDGSRVYVSTWGDGQISTPELDVINTATNTIITSVALADEIRAMRVSGNSLWAMGAFLTGIDATLDEYDISGSLPNLVQSIALNTANGLGPADLAMSGSQPMVAQLAIDGIDTVPGDEVPATLTDVTTTFGTNVEGNLASITESDNVYYRSASAFGFLSSQPNVLTIVVGAQAASSSAGTINVTIEARLNNPNGQVRVRLRNWNASFEQIGTYVLNTTDQVNMFSAANNNYIRPSGNRIEMEHRTIVVATFSVSGFQGRFDQVAFTTE
ncbi:MAG: YncE family protein [Phycisphaerales bacterium]